MTIYYVDPWNGANTNSGLSWAVAWKWPPGNGATINPGDEIRVAKSAEVLGTIYGALPSDIPISAYGYEEWYYGAPTYNPQVAGLTNSGSALLAAPNTVIPANTKLSYYAYGTKSVTAFATAIVKVTYNGIPSGSAGQYLRIALCSDTAGNTPVAWLTGATINGVDSANPDGTTSVTLFVLENPTNLNITINSVALYSVATFTTPNYTATWLFSYYMLFGPVSTGVNYLRTGSFIRCETPRLPNVTLGKTSFVVGSLCGTSVGSAAFNLYPGSRWSSQPTTPYYTYLRHYAPLPIPTDFYGTYEASLTFSGTAGSPIVISGGWDTATNTQTGYTNLGIHNVLTVPRKGSFVFSAGGQYVQFKRFLALQCPLAYYDYAVGTLSLLNINDCVYGSNIYSQGISVIGVSDTLNSTLDITATLITDCTAWDTVPVIKGRSACLPSGGMSTTKFPAGSLTFGTIDVVDSYVTHWNAGSLRIGTYLKHSSTVAGTIRSIISTTITVNLNIVGVASALLSIDDTVMSSTSLTYTHGVESAVANTSLSLTNIHVAPYHVTSGYDYAVNFLYFKAVTLNGLNLSNPNALRETRFSFTYSPTWWTNNPTGPVFSLAGALVGTAPKSTLEIVYPPLVLDWDTFNVSVPGGSSNYVGISLAKIWGQATYRNIKASFIQVEPYQSSASPVYYPNGPRVALYDCIGRVITPESAPLGTVRCYGGSLNTAQPYAGSNTLSFNEGPYAPGLALYGVTVPSYRDYRTDSDGRSVQHRGTLLVGIKSAVSASPKGYSHGSSSVNVVHLDPSVTIDGELMITNKDTPDITYGNRRGLLLRKPDGEFAFKAGGSVAYIKGPTNSYRKYPLRMYGSFPMGVIEVQAGTVVTITVRFRADTSSGSFTICIPPSLAYSADLHGHASRTNINTNEQDYVVNFSIAPTRDGEVHVLLTATVPITVKDFTTTVQ